MKKKKNVLLLGLNHLAQISMTISHSKKDRKGEGGGGEWMFGARKKERSNGFFAIILFSTSLKTY